MILFNENIVEILREHILNQFVDSVLLGSYGLGIQFSDVIIHCEERVLARIGSSSHEWNDAPSSAPWGSLVSQKVTDITLSSHNLLRIGFESGDYIEIETVEGQYESVVINLLTFRR